MPRRTPTLAALFALLLSVVGARPVAAEDPMLARVRQAADAVIAAFEGKDAAGLARLAGQDDPDPWLVADALFARGRLDAAQAFAKAAPRPDVEGLPSYLATLDGKTDDADLRARLQRANDAMGAQRFAEALAASDGELPPSPVAMVRLRLVMSSGHALARSGRLAEASGRFLAAAEAAERIGWIARATQSFELAGQAAHGAGNPAAARGAYARSLAVSERRGPVAALPTAGLRCALAGELDALGSHDEAVALYRTSLAAFESLGSPQGMAHALESLAWSLRGHGDKTGALEAFRRALGLLERIGDAPRVAHMHLEVGNTLTDLGRDAEARPELERARAGFEALGDQGMAAAAVINLGLLERKAGARDQAIALLLRGSELARAAGAGEYELNALVPLVEEYAARGEVERAVTTADRVLRVAEASQRPLKAGRALREIGLLRLRRDEPTLAVAAFTRAVEQFEAAGSRPQAASARNLLARAQGLAGDWAPVRALAESVLAEARALGDTRLEGEVWVTLGGERGAARDFAAARAAYGRALETFQRAGEVRRAAEMLQETARVYAVEGDASKALGAFEEALRASEAAGDRALFAWTLMYTSDVHMARGDLLKSLPLLERALAIWEGIGDRLGLANALLRVGVNHTYRGDYARALAADERALAVQQGAGDKAGAALTLGNIGVVYAQLGDATRALAWYRRALAAHEEVGNLEGQATTWGNIGGQHLALGQADEAGEAFDRQLRLSERLGDELEVARARLQGAALAEHRKDWAAALKVYAENLPVFEAHADRRMVAGVLASMGDAYDRMGDAEKALHHLERALRASEKLGAVAHQVTTLASMARVRLRTGDAGRAMDAAHRAVLLLKTVVGGLGEEQGAVARGQFSELFATGLAAAARADDPAEAVFFLESGRAGSLLEALGARSASRWAEMPEELRTAEREARAAEAAALVAYTKAAEGGDRAVERARAADLEAARGRVQEVIERIQRDEKKAQLWYPVAAPVEDLQALLQPGEALVLYGLADEGDAYAVVLTPTDARIVALGPTSAVVGACEALDADDPGGDPAAALERLSKLLVAPIALAPEVTRVLVSPEGPLSYVPFAALLPEREIAYMASGSTYGELIGQRALSGEKVLALADPDYAARFEPAALDLYALEQRGAGVPTRGRTLAPLPGTRAEAEALGDVKLLGARASEAGLREVLAKHPGRWRSVHFACHGLVDPERPTLSSLVLTPDAGNDGFLTALEVLRMEIPANLVVLSACETGRGKIAKGEGIVGLTRAFMYAGAPRVICSLWKVDDEATRALMTKFYEVWKGGQVPTAAALRQAQEHVRAQPKWKHPYYWAAWVLWGLP